MTGRSPSAQDPALFGTPGRRIRLMLALAGLLVLPFAASPFLLDLANQVLLAAIGALALMLLTGFAGLISLGTAGLGLYLAISTLGLHFVIVYLGGEYEAREALSTGVMIDPPSIGSVSLTSEIAWYFVLLAFAALALLISVNLQRSRTGRAWRALRERDVVAAALGIDVRRFKLFAFVVSATMTSIAGALFAYYRNFVSIDAFSLYLTVQYVAMMIIGGMGSITGELLGAAFVILFPYAIEAAATLLPARFGNVLFALDYAAFGIVMILFLLLEPAGLIGIWQRIRNVFVAARAR